MKSVAILTTGSELLDGRVLDTNSHFMASALNDLGFPLLRVVTCGDGIGEIRGSLEFLLRDVDFVIISGGLGPTTDDLTREAVCELVGDSLVLNDAVLSGLHEYYRKKQRVFDPTNTKQATFPSSAHVIENPNGTAAGFWIKTKSGKYIASLPGVPHELRYMFHQSVVPLIREALPDSRPLDTHLFRIFSVPESVIGGKIQALNLPQSVTVSYRAAFPEIQVKLKVEQNQIDLSKLSARVREAIGADFIFSEDLGLALESVIHKLLIERNLTLSVAESCTGGMLGAILTKSPGSSAYFMGGGVSYADRFKTDIFGVSDKLLASDGAVSESVVKAMAGGARKRWSTDYALAISGVAGPDGGTDEKPVGTFYICCAGPSGDIARRYFFSSSREWVRTFAACSALDLLRRQLLGLPIRSVIGKVEA